MTDSDQCTRIFALEGIGGSGKSHIARLLVDQLNDAGYTSRAFKVAGLGDSTRVNRLKRIMEVRHETFQQGKPSKKQLEDAKQERIFRLAMKHQVKLLQKQLSQDRLDIAILDRTPLMIWVYAASRDTNNPYLDDIFEECLSHTSLLDLEQVFLFQVEPEIAYARMIARYAWRHPRFDDLIEEACLQIGADEVATNKIQNEILRLCQQGNIQVKQFESWDLIPIWVTQNEITLHQYALEKAQTYFQFQVSHVDAKKSVDEILDDILQSIMHGASEHEDIDYARLPAN